MCQIGNPRGTHPCRQSGCAGRSCRLHAHRTWPRNQWHQCYSTGFWSRKYSLKNHWKVKNAFCFCSGCGVTLSPLWIPRASPAPSQGGRQEIFGLGLEKAALGTPHHLSGWFVCSGTFLRYQLMPSWDQVLQSKSFLQDCSSCQCSAAAPALSTHICTAPVIPHVSTALCSSSTGSQGLSQN